MLDEAHEGNLKEERMSSGEVERLAEAYRRKGDLDFEIAGWKKLVNKNLENSRRGRYSENSERFSIRLSEKLADAYQRKGNIDFEIAGWKKLVTPKNLDKPQRGRYLENEGLTSGFSEKLADAYQHKGDIDFEIAEWNTKLVNKSLQNSQRGRYSENEGFSIGFSEKLADAYQRKGNINFEIAGWNELVNKNFENSRRGRYSENKGLSSGFGEKLADAYQRKGDIDFEIDGWNELVNKNLENLSLGRYSENSEGLSIGFSEQLADAYQRKGDIDFEIAEWKKLVTHKNLGNRQWGRYLENKGPISSGLSEKLANAYQRKGDIDFEIAGWNELVNKNLENSQREGYSGNSEHLSIGFSEKLADAYRRKGDIDFEIAGWQELLNVRSLESQRRGGYSENEVLSRRFSEKLADAYRRKGDIDFEKLADAYQRKGDIDFEIAQWKELMSNDPSGNLSDKLADAYRCNGVIDSEPARWKEPVNNDPSGKFGEKLTDAYRRTGDIDFGLARWKEFVKNDPSHKFREKLADAYRLKGDIDFEIAEWKELMSNDSSGKVSENLADAYRRKGDINFEIAGWKELMSNDSSGNVSEKLADAYLRRTDADQRIGDIDHEIAVRRELVRMNPGNLEFHNSLADAYRRGDNIDVEIIGWKELIRTTLGTGWRLVRDKLASAYQCKGDIDIEIDGWNELMDQKVSSAYRLDAKLANAYRRKGDIDFEIHGWEKRHEKEPSDPGLLHRLKDARNRKEQTKKNDDRAGHPSLSGPLDSDTPPNTTPLKEPDFLFPSPLTTLLAQDKAAVNSSQTSQSLRKFYGRDNLLNADDVTGATIEAWFAFANYNSFDSKGDGARIVDKFKLRLSMVVGSPASRRRELALEVSFAYLLAARQFFGVNTEQTKLLTCSFARLTSIYPEELIVILALSSSYLHTRDYYNSLSGMLRLSMSKKLDEGIRTAISKVMENWISRVSTLPELCPRILVPRILLYAWRAPSVFKKTESVPFDLPLFITLTNVTINDRSVGIRADQLSDYASERWGYLGSIGVAKYQELITSVLKDPNTPQVTSLNIPWISSGYTITGTYDYLSICAICQDTEWNDLVEFVLWIDGVVGVPEHPSIRNRTCLVKEEIRISEDCDEGAFLRQGTLAGTKDHISKLEALEIGLRTRFPSADIDIPVSTILLESFYNSANDGVDVAHWFQGDSGANTLCWTKLFKRAFISFCSSPALMPYPQLGKGLRISFDLMIAIAGVDKVVVRDGGIVLAGFCAALIPIRVINQSDMSVQWHFMEHKDKENCYHAIHNCELFWNAVPKVRLLETSFDKLKGPAFIGWHEKVKIVLATQKLASVPEYSDVPPVTQQWRQTQRSTGVGLQYTIPLGPGVSVHHTRVSSSAETQTQYRTCDQFSVRLKSLNQSTSVIYDDGRKTAWVCPTIYVVLFLLRSYLEQEAVDMPTIAFPPSCDVLTKTLAPSAQVMKFIKSIEDLKKVEVPGEKSATELLTMLHDRYDDARAKLGIRTDYRESLVGVELRDLMDVGCRHAFPKELKVKSGIRFWSSLVDTELVVFCKNLGDVIEPVVEEMADGEIGRTAPFSTCIAPPDHQNILICPLYLLKQKLEKRSYKTTGFGFEINGRGGYKWRIHGNPYVCSEKGVGGMCDGRRCWPHRIQQLVPNDYQRWNFRRYPTTTTKVSSSVLVSLDGQGALCFGSTEH
jgi:tetratricopeptide (TPR) repeat protein